MEMGKVPTPNGGLVPPIFFYSKNIKTGRSRYGVSTELARSIHRGASLGGRRREKCVSDRVIDGASTECQSVHSAYAVHVVRTKPRPNLHPNPHLLT